MGPSEGSIPGSRRETGTAREPCDGDAPARAGTRRGPATLCRAGVELRKASLHLSRHRPAPRGDGDVGATGGSRGPLWEPAAAGSTRRPCPSNAPPRPRLPSVSWVAGGWQGRWRSVPGCLGPRRSRVPSRPLTVPARLHVAGAAPLRVREARAGRRAGHHGSCSSWRAGRP